MNDIQDHIRELVLGFFRTTGSEISEDGSIYRIEIPEEYRTYFETGRIAITFGSVEASRHDCEPVVPGNKILRTVMDICAKKGPVTLRYNTGNRATIRYHFFIRFYGLSDVSILDHVDVELDSPVPENFAVDGDKTLQLGWIKQRDVTSTYSYALDQLQTRHKDTVEDFLRVASQRLAEDLGVALDKHNMRARELDDAIRRKDADGSDYHDRIQEFRFDTVEKMEDLENKKASLADSMQQRHRVTLEYGLVACEVLAS